MWVPGPTCCILTLRYKSVDAVSVINGWMLFVLSLCVTMNRVVKSHSKQLLLVVFMSLSYLIERINGLLITSIICWARIYHASPTASYFEVKNKFLHKAANPHIIDAWVYKKLGTVYAIKCNCQKTLSLESYMFCLSLWLLCVCVFLNHCGLCVLQEKPVHPPCGITTPGCISMTTPQRGSLHSLSRTSSMPCSLTPASSSCWGTLWRGGSHFLFHSITH